MLNRFEKSGAMVTVSQINAGPVFVVDKKESTIQIGFGRKKKAKKTENKFVTNIGYAPKHIREIKTPENSEVKTGDQITVSIFQKQDLVKVTGTSKGRGFAGGIKRWGFHGGPKTHGQSDRHRAPGSIGQTTTPGRVFKGKKMAGHYGAERKTINNLEIFDIDLGNNIIEVKGSVPGPRGGFLIIEKTGKAKAYVAPPEEKPKDEDEEEKPKDEATDQKPKEEEEKKD